MKITSRLLLSSCLVAGLAAQAFAQDGIETLPGAGAPLTPAAFDTVVATVNGTDITAGEVALMRNRLPQQYQQMPDGDMFDMILEQMINQELLSKTLERQPVIVDAAVANEARSLRSGVALRDVVQAAVTEEALQALYEETYKDAEPSREFNAAHILVETEAEAQEIVNELNAGADFAELARTRSTGPSGPNGGDLGWFGKGMMVAPFEEAVMALEPGQVSAPVQTQFGWHVIKLMETRLSAAPALDDVREELSNTLQRRAVEDRLNALVDAAEIVRKSSQDIDPAFLSDPRFGEGFDK